MTPKDKAKELVEKNIIGYEVREFTLKNMPDHIKYCVIIEYSSGVVLLNWTGKTFGGEGGFFKSLRAAKSYVTKTITSVKSLWFQNESTQL